MRQIKNEEEKGGIGEEETRNKVTQFRAAEREERGNRGR
jgi:hypothetical protein